MVTSIQEMQWVLRAQFSDREALEALLRSVQPSLRRYLSGLAGAGDVDDLLQDVLVIVIRRLGTLDDPKLFRPWVFRIASREAFRHIRKRRLLLLLALMFGVEAMHAGNTYRLVHHILIALVFWTALLALVVVIQMTVMTKRILRAIELAARSNGPSLNGTSSTRPGESGRRSSSIDRPGLA